MVRVPDRVRRTPTTARGASWQMWYKPANTQRDLPPRTGTKAMDAFLMSDRIQDVSYEASQDVVGEAERLTAALGVVESGEYISGFKVEPDHIVMASDDHPNPRRASRVVNDADHAATVEYGARNGEGMRIMRLAGAKYDSPKGGGPE